MLLHRPQAYRPTGSPDQHSTARITAVNYAALAQPLSQRSSKSFVGEVGEETDRQIIHSGVPNLPREDKHVPDIHPYSSPLREAGRHGSSCQGRGHQTGVGSDSLTVTACLRYYWNSGPGLCISPPSSAECRQDHQQMKPEVIGLTLFLPATPLFSFGRKDFFTFLIAGKASHLFPL